MEIKIIRVVGRIKTNTPMPKDYQEMIEEISINITSHLAGVLPSGLYDRLENDIINALTTYGNAREEEIIKIIKSTLGETSLSADLIKAIKK